MWEVFDKEIGKMIQPNIVSRMNQQVCAADTRLELGTINPVGKVLLLASDYECNYWLKKLLKKIVLW